MNEFDKLVEQIRGTEKEPGEAADRVRDRLRLGLNSVCSGFRADFAAARAGRLSEARKMLFDDHLKSCVHCRREYSGAGPAVVEMPKRSPLRRTAIWSAVAAVAIAAIGVGAMPTLDRVLAPSGPRAAVASVTGSLVLISAEGATALSAGAEIAEGQEVRTGRDSRAILRLRDGSLVEMDERTSLSLNERWRGKTVRLARGNVMIEAAKQRSGRLEVATTDALVSVKGTIFDVRSGLKGSRISVVEGEVAVDGGGTSVLLHKGDQSVTHASIGRTAVTDEVSWSTNAAKYLQLLAGLDAAGRQISQLPMPGLRYSSRLLDRVPANAFVVAAVPNLGATLNDAVRIMDDQARQNAALNEWWNGTGAGEMRKALDEVRAVTQYLGEEIVVAVLEDDPIVLAEVNNPAGLTEHLSRLGGTGHFAIDGGLVAIGVATVPAPSGFSSTAFGQRLSQSYTRGAGLLFGANMEQIFAKDVDSSDVQTRSIAGLDNVRFLVAESKMNLGQTEHSATLTFAGARHGVASWLAAPGPMGSLEFVTPQASLAASFVTRDPQQMLEELIGAIGPDAANALAEVKSETGINLLDDIAGTMGGEATFALDGALLPVPEWKLAIEVDDPARLQWAMEQLAPALAQHSGGEVNLALSKETVNGRTYHALTTSATSMAIHYTFVDGYLLAGPSRAVLMAAMNTRGTAASLPRSDAFRAQMPLNGQAYFSGVVYYNIGSALGPLADQLKDSGIMTPEQEQAVSSLTGNREPSLIYVYGQQDNIQVGSRSGLLNMGMQFMSGLATGHLNQALFPMQGMGGTQ